MNRLDEPTSQLRLAVAQRFAVTGAATPGWADPHPGLAVPEDEQYSRCLDPAKFLILRARVDAWGDVLRARGLLHVEPAPDLADTAQYDRVVRWRPSRPGALSLVFGWRGFDGVAENVVTVGVGDEPRWILDLPGCGCDACDEGSARYLEMLDDQVDDVVRGTFVHVTTLDGATIHTTGSGWSGSGDSGALAEAQGLLAAGRDAVPTGRVLRSLTGTSWL